MPFRNRMRESKESIVKRAAVIGLGDVSSVHMNALKANDEVTICAVCDIDEKKREEYADIPFYSDYHELFEKEKPDCVHLCLPHYLHYPVACEAAKAGIHIFCEKPMATDKREALEYVALEEAYPELHIGICLQNRRNSSVIMLKSIIDGGEYGALTGMRGFVPWKRMKSYYDVKPWRGQWDKAGSGVMHNQSIHTLDLMYYLGGGIEELKAMTGQLLDYSIEVEDTVAVGIKYENGASGLFFATNANYKNDSVSIQAALEKGEFLIQDNCLYKIDEDGGRELLVEDEKLPGTKFYYGAGHGKLINEFYRALEEGTQDYIHVKDSLMSIELIDACLKSSRFGTAVKIEK